MNNKEERKILVTGATGTVGSEVVKQLVPISPENTIRAVIHSKNGANKIRHFANMNVEIVELDYMVPETITNAFHFVDKIFLQTLPVPQAADICSNIIREAKKNDVRYIVKLSAMGADSQSESTILRLHGEEERIIKESGIPYTFLRPPAFMQNFITQFSQTIKTQNAFYIPAGDAKMSFVDARDIAAVAARLLNSSNELENEYYVNKAFDITGPETLSYSQVAEILSNETGEKILYVDVTEDATRKEMKELGMNSWSIDIMIELFRIIKEGYGIETIDTVERITGRKPIPFAQFAKDYVKIFS